MMREKQCLQRRSAGPCVLAVLIGWSAIVWLGPLSGITACSAGEGSDAGKSSAKDSAAVVLVMTRSPGRLATEIETTITDPLERRFVRAKGAQRIESRAVAGLSAIQVSFRADVSPELALATIDALAQSSRGDLPPGTSPPLVMPLDFDFSLPVGYVTVESQDEMADYAKLAASRLFAPLNAIAGAGPPALLGAKEPVTLIRLNNDKLLARHLGAQDVMDAIQRAIPNQGSSVLRMGDMSSAVTISGFKPDEPELGETPIRGEGVGGCLLRDVAAISQAFVAPGRSLNVNGIDKVVVALYATDRSGAAEVRDAAKRVVEDLKGRETSVKFTFLPVGISGGPEVDDGLVTLQLRLRSGSRLEKTEQRCRELEDLIRRELGDEVSYFVSLVGVSDDWPAAFCANAAECDATIRVQLSATRDRSAADAAKRLRSAVAQRAEFRGLDLQIITGSTEVIEARATGPAIEARQIVDRLLAAVRDDHAQARIVERLDAPVFQVSVDARKAADVGVTVGNVALAIASLTGGPSASWTDPRSGERIQLAGGYVARSVEDLMNVTTPLSRNATTIPLGNLISVRQVRMPLEIDHVNLLPVVRAEFLVDRQTREAEASKIAAAIRDIDLPEGVQMIEMRAGAYPAAR